MAEQSDTTPNPMAPESEPKVMCYISKEMVPIGQTVEIDYGGGKSFRVQAKYVKFPLKVGEPSPS